MIKVLITPAGNETGIEIYKSLRHRREIQTVGADMSESNPSTLLMDKMYIVPPFSRREFYDDIRKICAHEKMDVIFPTDDRLVVKMSLMNIPGTKIICPCNETAEIISSKRKTYEFLRDMIRVPSCISNPVKFPVFIKPEYGRGSVDAHKIDSHDEYEFYMRKIKDPLCLEFLPGKEYTTDCLSDMQGNIMCVSTRERMMMKYGITTIGKTVDNSRFYEIAKLISSRMKTRGCWFFQTKEDKDGNPVLLEINFRIPGTMCLTRISGVNMPLITLWMYLGRNMDGIDPLKENFHVRRHFTEEYVWDGLRDLKLAIFDLDQTLWDMDQKTGCVTVRENTPRVISHLKSMGVRIGIATQNPTLSSMVFKYAVQFVISHIDADPNLIRISERSSSKSGSILSICEEAGIEPENTIFVDDSYAIRKDVSEKIKDIKTFDSSICYDMANMKVGGGSSVIQ